MYKIKDLYDLNETIAAKLFDGVEYPWEVLANIGDFIIELGKTLPKDKFDHPQEDIWIAKDVTIAKTATLNGPLYRSKTWGIYPWKSYCWKRLCCW